MKDTFVQIMVPLELHIKHSVEKSLCRAWASLLSPYKSNYLFSSHQAVAGVALTSLLSPAGSGRAGQIQTNWFEDSRYTIQNGHCERKHLPNPSPALPPLPH